MTQIGPTNTLERIGLCGRDQANAPAPAAWRRR